jgi:TRAP-type uncharacterized transport system substrate-binding protein
MVMHSVVARAFLAGLVAAAALLPLSGAVAGDSASAEATAANKAVIGIETGRAADISVQMAEDIAGLVDDGSTRRVLPVVGKGALQTLADLRVLHGVDLAIVQADALDYAREQHFQPGLETSITYVAKLYNEEFHLLAGPDIKSVADLAGKTVNVDVQGSGTAVTAIRVFDLLKVKVTMTTDPTPVALDKLRGGKIAALAFVAAKPLPLFKDLKPKDGLHLLGIPLSLALTNAYAPTAITAADYPDLLASDQTVETVAVASVLMAADLRTAPERMRNVTNFVEALFGGFPTLLEPGHQAKWQEVNIAAELPGWTRFPAAQKWLQQNMQVATLANPDILKALFAQFVDERREASGGSPMTAAEKDALFEQFRAWQRGQAK